MPLTKKLGFMLFMVSTIALISQFVIAVYLGPTIRKVDPHAHQRLYAFFLPCSAALLFDYVNTNNNLVSYTKINRRLLQIIRFLLPIALISFLAMFVLVLV